MDITIPYYEDNTRISNSNIGQYLKYGPKYLRDMLDGKEEGLSAKYLDKGTMIHMYLLQSNEFWDNYVVADDFEVPRSQQQKDFAEAIINSVELEADKKILDAYNKTINSKTKSEELRLRDAKQLAEQLSSYIKFLELNKDSKKTVITWADMNMLKTIKDNILAHKKANELLFNLPDYETYNEFHINWDFPKTYFDNSVKCKSLLDRVAFDHKNKKIILMDIKTTISVENFAHSIEEFDYARQLAYYWLAIHAYILKELNLNIDEYTFETYIIAIQNNGSYQTRVFKIDPYLIESRLDTISNTISNISWHIKNNQWDHHIEYYDGDGSELIK